LKLRMRTSSSCFQKVAPVPEFRAAINRNIYTNRDCRATALRPTVSLASSRSAKDRQWCPIRVSSRQSTVPTRDCAERVRTRAAGRSRLAALRSVSLRNTADAADDELA
jgi:hypothetical protein